MYTPPITIKHKLVPLSFLEMQIMNGTLNYQPRRVVVF